MTTKEEEKEEFSGSDFDEDEDPDKIEVPGGGKDLAAAAALAGSKPKPKTAMFDMPIPQMPNMGPHYGGNSKMPSGMPSPFDMMRSPMGSPYGMGSMAAMASMLSGLGGPMNMGQMFPPGAGGGGNPASAAFHAAHFLQQSVNFHPSLLLCVHKERISYSLTA